ncbi:MAG: ACT domain-containing protein [Clostridiaceae bacterium]|nr:ACT domain-containing protein [Clostridiaceae bacterium]
MADNDRLILVDASKLPSVFLKVLKAKTLLDSGEASTVNEAVNKVGISRSAFYKYKDFVFTFNKMQNIITISFVLLDKKGILSEVLNVLAQAKTNILTINQNIPINGVANIIISASTENMEGDTDTLLKKLKEIDGVKEISVLASQ